MGVGAITDIGEQMRRVGERREARPGRAFAAHLGEGARRVAVVHRHEMAADAGAGETALRQLGGGGVRAAGAERRDAAQQARRAVDHRRRRRVGQVQPARAQERAQRRADQFRRQLQQRRQQRRAGRQRLAGDLGALVGRQVVQRVAQLRLDEAALLLDHQQRALAAGEVAQPLGLQRPGHADLVQRQLRMALQPQRAQRVQRVRMRAPDGDQADRRIGRAEHQPVQPVGPRPGERRRQPLHHHAAFQLGAVGRDSAACGRCSSRAAAPGGRARRSRAAPG